MTLVQRGPARFLFRATLTRLLWGVAFAVLSLLLLNACIGSRTPVDLRADEMHDATSDLCTRPAVGSVVSDAEDLRSKEGVLTVYLAIRNHREADGSIRYCYTLASGAQAPTLRLHPGDLLVLRLTNALADVGSTGTRPMCRAPRGTSPCNGGTMTALSTNLHFHGLTAPPTCQQDDVLKTLVQPGDAPFEYRLRIPDDEPPGLYWYHPHVHGFSSMEVAGGASGALIVEGIERANPTVAGLPERVLVIRDQPLLNPHAAPAIIGSVAPAVSYDREGDVISTGIGSGMPARDLSVNYVPVPYPDYPAAAISMRPGEKQLWRVLNASSLTYLDLAVRAGGVQQALGVVAIDGVPVNHAGGTAPSALWLNHVSLPPGARAEFIVTAPPSGVAASLVTHWVDTGPGGENDPERTLASITSTTAISTPASTLPLAHDPLPSSGITWVGDVRPVRVRKLHFSEKLADPNDPASATAFFLTEEGHAPAAFDPGASAPDIVVRQGEVEDWIIENRSAEVHAFHIHQLHFQLRDWGPKPVNEPFLRDTINLPYYNPTMPAYPSVRLRMDFRDPDSVGTFVYHCHVLEHEDGGMMGTLRVEPAGTSAAAGMNRRELSQQQPESDNDHQRG